MKQSRQFILVTTGDADGIGLEVAAKALARLSKSFFKKISVCIFVSKSHQKKYISFLEKTFSVVKLECSSKNFSLDLLDNPKTEKKPLLFMVLASDSPPDWIHHLSILCSRHPKSSALVTGPLSKTLIKDCGYKAIGHTEIMAEATGASPLFMGFVGKYFNVVLLTGHIPLKKVSDALKKLDWDALLRHVMSFTHGLPQRNLPMALVGVNPHAGENGMISSGEETFLKDVMDKTTLKIVGPLVPDAAFLRSNWKKYSVYLTCYHDQGLIPFKTIHGQDSGVHVTIGLPFVRTSVDHGTAKEIFGKDIANPNSMKEALILAQRLLS